MATSDARTRLRRLGQYDLGAWVETATGEYLWHVQREIAAALSVPHAQVTVPSCFSSGKTWLAGRLALAFYDAYQPGTPCDYCDPDGTKGGCRGAKVITTSSKEDHLKHNLWGEIRSAYAKIRDRVGIDGALPPADMALLHEPMHFIIGQVATASEGFQGYHAAHVLVIGDEATSVSDAVSQGIQGLLASGDARLLLIFNPTTPDTYAAVKTKSNLTKTIRISAFQTPNFTNEPVPPGANLVSQRFLDDLESQGQGPGTYEWTTKVLAEFWDLGEDNLVQEKWYQDARSGLWVRGVRALGIDLAAYGSSENVISVRDGNSLIEQRAFPAGRTELFFEGPVTEMVLRHDPHYVIYDADGVGSGAVGYAENLYRHLSSGAQVVGFRGALATTSAYSNTRSTWYWHLRRLFESGVIVVSDLAHSPQLMEQITSIKYGIRNGAIRLETKEEMKKRGMASPDRADGLMYAFALSSDLYIPKAKPKPVDNVEKVFGVHDHSDDAMWRKDMEKFDRARKGGRQVHPILGVKDW